MKRGGAGNKQVGGSGTVIAILIFAVICIIGVGFVWFYHSRKSEKQKNVIQTPVDDNKVCMTTDMYQKLIDKIAVVGEEKEVVAVSNTSLATSLARDYRVLNDPLYPPLNRTETPTHLMLEENIKQRNMYVPTNETGDNYRLVGYLVSNEEKRDAGGNNWKLFARQKDRHMADFYIIPSNNNYDIKLVIKDDMMVGPRMRDMYTIPSEVTFKNPMLNTGPYQFIEVPKADLATSGRYI